LCRVRIERPLPLDLRAIAEGVIKNNMGIGGIEVRVRGELANGIATLAETGQQLPVQGGPAKSSSPWLWVQAREYGLGHVDAVAWLRESPEPSLVPPPR
jgi:hypothetical protein